MLRSRFTCLVIERPIIFIDAETGNSKSFDCAIHFVRHRRTGQPEAVALYMKNNNKYELHKNMYHVYDNGKVQVWNV